MSSICSGSGSHGGKDNILFFRSEMGMARWQSGIADGSISTKRAHNQPRPWFDIRRREWSRKVLIVLDLMLYHESINLVENCSHIGMMDDTEISCKSRLHIS
jgi:hypothetical protein